MKDQLNSLNLVNANLSKNIMSSQMFQNMISIKGYLYCLLGNLILSISFFFYKYYTNVRGLEPETLIAYRGSFITIYSGIYILLNLKSMNKFKLNHIGSLIFRATINGLGMLSVVYALKFLRVSTCELILRSGNLMSVFLGYLMLNEKVTIYDIYGLISTFLGVVLILKPSIIFGKTSVGEDQLIGLVFAFICAFIISWGMIISKQLLEYFEVIFTLLFMGFAGCIVGVIVAQIRGIDITIDLWDLFGLMFCILFEFMGALLNFIALGHEPVSKLAPFYNSRIIYSVVLVYVLSGAVDFYDITGVVIIVITYIYISIEKIKLSNNQT